MKPAFLYHIASRPVIRVFLIASIVLLVPLIAMQISSEVNWSSVDFIVMGVLLISTGLLFELLLLKVHSTMYRFVFTVLLVLIVLLIWAELAVGLFGTPIAGS